MGDKQKVDLYFPRLIPSKPFFPGICGKKNFQPACAFAFQFP